MLNLYFTNNIFSSYNLKKFNNSFFIKKFFLNFYKLTPVCTWVNKKNSFLIRKANFFIFFNYFNLCFYKIILNL